MNRKQYEYDKAVWLHVTKCEQKAKKLADLYAVFDECDARLIREGKVGLYEQVRQRSLQQAKNTTKLNRRAQEPTRIEATISTALFIVLVMVLTYTVACSI